MKKSYPKISVVIPSFNQGNFIEETILSIINQKYPNLELIIIDALSTDNTLEIVKKYYDSISYFVSEKIMDNLMLWIRVLKLLLGRYVHT